MADNNPRDILNPPGFSNWGSVGVPKENIVYDFLDEVKEKTDAFFETIMSIFELVNSFLDFIASLLIDFTNPLKPILEEIVAIIEAFIQDLRNLGLYYTYDFEELKNPTEKLLGGYPAFENRMVIKLLNQSDPTRPNFTDKTKTFAMTFFAGADLSDIDKIIAYFKKLVKFFTPGKDEPAKAPINVEAVYYNDFIGEVELPNTHEPDGIRVKWNLPPPNSTMPALPKTFVNPDYFIISVSTQNNRDQLGYLEKVDDNSVNDFYFGPSHLNEACFWPLLDNQKTGIFNLSKLDEDATYERLPNIPADMGEGGSWVIIGDSEVYLNKRDKDKLSDLYKVFLYSDKFDSVIGDNDFYFDIPFENLTVQNQLKDEYHIKICSFEIDSDNFKTLTLEKEDIEGTFRFGTQQEVKSLNLIYPLLTPGGGLELGSNGSLSKPSSTVSITAPSDLKTKYLNAIRFFFLAYYLGRFDEESNQKLAKVNPLNPTEEKVLSKFLDRLENDNYPTNSVYISPKEHAAQVIKWVDRVMMNFKFSVPKDSVLRPHLSDLNKINNFKYNLYEQLQAIANDEELSFGLGSGIYEDAKQFEFETDISIFMTDGEYISIPKEEYLNGNYAPVSEVKYFGYDTALKLLEDSEPDPFPDFFTGSLFFNDKIYPHGGPIAYFPDGDLKFFGEFIYMKDFVKTYNLARPLVILASKSIEKGQWKNIRPFRDTDLGSILSVLETVKKFLEGFLKSLEGIVAQILKYIQILKTRISQLQNIIQKIKAFVDLILGLRLPAGLYGTFHLADGTAGLVNSLTQSVNKPDIGNEGVGTGLMVVAGGVPSILVDFFIALMGGNSQEE